MEPGIKTVKTIQWKPGTWEDVSDGVVVETLVSLTVNGEIWTTFLCSPTHLDSLAVGFLFNEDFIQHLEDIVDTRICPTGDNVDVWTSRALERPTTWQRTTDCTGGIAAENQPKSQPAIELCEAHLKADQIGPLMQQLFDAQGVYRQTGGVHSSALSDGKSLLLFADDIGQPNTLDKLVGMSLLGQIQPTQRVLLTTGRVSSEIIRKAARLQASVVITRGSPSSLSVEMAEAAGITLIGHAHSDCFTIYSHPQRIER